jgi:hypothetical protein
MGLDGLSNLIEGGQMQDQPDVPRDELTKEELAARGEQPDDAQAAEADQVQVGHDEAQQEGGGDDGDDDGGAEPAPVDDPNLPDDGDPEADGLDPEPIPPGDFKDPEPETSDTGEVREDPADLSGIQKEFED